MHTPRELAGLLWGQHQSRAPFASIASLLASADPAAAYAVQNELVQLMIPTEGPPKGYKIGLTSLRMQQMCGLSQPVAGRILERRIHRSPARVELDEFSRLGVESELCVILKDDLTGAASITIDDVARAVGGVAAAFELIDDRGADYARLDAVSLIADNSWNAGVVIGEPAPLGGRNDALHVGHLDGALYVDEQLADCGNSRDALSHPFAVVQWLANHLSSLGCALRAGDFVMTGSIVPTRFARAGVHYRFELTGLAPVELGVA
jgi:2-keto-4-pentenoate hydratase